jgi:DNA-binding CsgD family transcriptional regulator/PAS domain-containing protein
MAHPVHENNKMPSPILERLAPRYDPVVEDIYRAGSGLHSWLRPIEQIADIFDAWAVQLLGVSKKTGVMLFSFEGGSGPPAGAIEYLRHYHRIDPRLGKFLPAPQGEWFACEEHFDEAFVASSPFYQDYLIPLGGRYLYGTKLHDDESSTVLIGHLSRVGNPPLSPPEKEAFRRLSTHFQKALDIKRTLEANADRHSVGAELLEKLRQPMILIDNERRITYGNHSARALLGRRDIVYESEGLLACRDAGSDLDLTIAIRSLGLVPISSIGDQVDIQDRRVVRLKRRDGSNVAGTLIALRPESTMGSFGRTPQALFTVFEPGAPVDIDPFILSTTFDLTPAEARVAAAIVGGGSPEQCAKELNVKLSTVRSQLVAIYRKTGATGQADLVRLILSATTL